MKEIPAGFPDNVNIKVSNDHVLLPIEQKAFEDTLKKAGFNEGEEVSPDFNLTIANDVSIFIQSQLTEDKSFSDFRLSIRAAIRGLYRADIGLLAFVDSMRLAIERNYRKAWLQGARECGIKEDELTREEINRREGMINEQLPFLIPFGEDIIAGRDDKLISTFFSRGQMWSNRWFAVRDVGNSMACENQKMEWVWSPEKEHCCDCRNLNGRVYRNKIWDKHDIHVRSDRLACFGGHCGCRKVPTDKPVTPGRPPALKGPGGC